MAQKWTRGWYTPFPGCSGYGDQSKHAVTPSEVTCAACTRTHRPLHPAKAGWLDPHSHLTQRRFEAADLLVAWKEFPHVDIEERSRELVSLTLRSLRREVRPVMAKHDCRMITSLPTTQPAIREFVDKCMATEHHSEMSSLSTLDVHPGELNAESDSFRVPAHSPPSAVQAGATRASCRFRS